MTPSKFRKLSLEYFCGLLSGHGFQVQENYGPTYYRQIEGEIYHFIMPQICSYGDWYDIMVFGNSPHINSRFDERFEKGIDVPSAARSFLDPRDGIHWGQYRYRCKSEDDFIESSTKEALPALLEFGLPYLNKIETVADLIKTVHPQVAHAYDLTGG